MKCKRKNCNKKLDKKEIARKYGIESAIFEQGYCSPQCYTQDIMNKPKIIEDFDIIFRTPNKEESRLIDNEEEQYFKINYN